MNTFLSPRALVGAAIVGIVGAAGVFIYEQIYAEKRRTMLVREVARLDKQVATMRSELETLKELQKETNMRRLKQKKVRKIRATKAAPTGDTMVVPEQYYTSDSEYFTDYASVLGESEMDSEEFYDVPTDDDDDDDDTLRESLRNGHVTELIDDDKEDAQKSFKNPT